MYNVLHLTLMWLGSYKCVSDKKILVLSWHKMSFDIFLGCLWCNDRRSYRWTLGGGAAGLQVKTWIWCQLKSFFVVSCPRWSDTKLMFWTDAKMTLWFWMMILIWPRSSTNVETLANTIFLRNWRTGLFVPRNLSGWVKKVVINGLKIV